MEDNIQGPLLPELEEIAPKAFAARIKRVGIVNPMHDPNFSRTVQPPAGRRSWSPGSRPRSASSSRSSSCSTRDTRCR
jgi:hypothetical protein